MAANSQPPSMGPLPPGVGAALLDKHAPPREPILNPGQLPVVFANDVKLSATNHEVVITFAVRGGDDAGSVVEVSRVAMTWPGLEALGNILTQILTQAMEFRRQGLEQQMRAMDDLMARMQSLTDALGQQPPSGN